jgi:hypothetical protein
MGVLPWYGALFTSPWYYILAFLGTTFGVIICGESLVILHEELNDRGEDSIFTIFDE